MIINGGLDPDLFCLTDKIEEAHAFYRRRKGGVIHLVNEQTDTLNRLVDIFNQAQQDARKPDVDIEAAILGNMCALLSQIMGHTLVKYRTTLEIHEPHNEYGWEDAPHNHNDLAAFIYGKERPSELSHGPLVDTHEWRTTKENPYIQKRAWGRLGDESSVGFLAAQPFSFADKGLDILVPRLTTGEKLAPAHSIPLQLHPDEQRGSIAIVRYNFL